MSYSSERSAKKPKLAQPLLKHFFPAQTSLTSPDCDPDSQSAEGLNEFFTLSQPESAEPQHITLQPPIQVGQDFNPHLVAKETHCLGNQKFNKAWLAEIPWLRYDESLDLCWCSVCVWGLNADMLPANENKDRFSENSFVTGWNNWHGGRSKLLRHTGADAGSLKHNVHHYLASVKAAHENQLIIKAQVSGRKKQEMQRNRIGLDAVISSIQLLARQGMPLRGHGEEKDTANIWHEVKLISSFNEDVKFYINGSGYKFMSVPIQNECLKMLGDSVQDIIVKKIKKSGWFTCIMDETQDISTLEQVCICIRYVDESDLSVREDFLGFHNILGTTALELYDILIKTLNNLCLDMQNCRGQAYDGASNVSGHVSGLQTLVRSHYPKALYSHCAGHNLNLVLNDVAKEVRQCYHIVTLVGKIGAYVKDSAKRKVHFDQIRVANSEDGKIGSSNVRPICPTRWILRYPAVNAILENYEDLLDFLSTSSDNENKAQGYVRELQRFEVYFGVRILHRIFGQVHPVHNAIQSESMSLGECSSIVTALTAALRIDGESVDIFTEFMTSSKTSALTMGIELPAVPRGLAKRVNRGNRVDWEIDDAVVDNYYHGIWTKMYNSLVVSLTKRFQGKAIDIVRDFQDILSNISEDSNYEFPTPSMNSLMELYTTDLNWKFLKLEMIQWVRVSKISNPTKHTTDLKYLHKYLSEKSDHRLMWPNLVLFLKLYLLLPCTSCSAERGFSCLRRIKTYLRSTMSEDRLNACALCNVHNEILDQLDIGKITDEWINRSEVRMNRFVLSEDSLRNS